MDDLDIYEHDINPLTVGYCNSPKLWHYHRYFAEYRKIGPRAKQICRDAHSTVGRYSISVPPATINIYQSEVPLSEYYRNGVPLPRSGNTTALVRKTMHRPAVCIISKHQC